MKLGGFGLAGAMGMKHSESDTDPRSLKQAANAADEEAGESGSGSEDVELTPDMEDWMQEADGGELDIYTCIGLSNGRDKFGPRTRQMVPVMMMLMFLQLLLPALLMSWYTGYHKPAKESGLEFRITGFGLYGYAVYNMYGSALDECRSRFLQLGIEHNISPWYTLPMLLGEFSNSFTGCILTLALFAIFCASETPVDLILNSLAINFLVSADNDFSEDAVRDAAKHDFRKCMRLDINAPVTAANQLRNVLLNFAMCCCMLMRVVGILGVGFMLSWTFLFGWQDWLCSEMPSTARRLFPFCPVNE